MKRGSTMSNWELVVRNLQEAPALARASGTAGTMRTRNIGMEETSEVQCGAKLVKLAEARAKRSAIQFDEEDDAVEIEDSSLSSQLLVIDERNDSPETILHKSLWNLMANDLRAIVTRRNESAFSGPDMFDFVHPDTDELRLYDALSWIYGFQRPLSDELIDGKLVKDTMVTFDATCYYLDQDAELFRRVLARPVRSQMRGLLRAIDGINSEYADHCERKLSPYVDLSGWRHQ